MSRDRIRALVEARFAFAGALASGDLAGMDSHGRILAAAEGYAEPEVEHREPDDPDALTAQALDTDDPGERGRLLDRALAARRLQHDD